MGKGTIALEEVQAVGASARAVQSKTLGGRTALWIAGKAQSRLQRLGRTG